MKRNNHYYVITDSTFDKKSLLCYSYANKIHDGTLGDGYFFTSSANFVKLAKDRNAYKYPVLVKDKKAARTIIQLCDLKKSNTVKIEHFDYDMGF